MTDRVPGSMADILKDFQSAIASGNSDSAKSHLTENAIMRVGNRNEVTGAQAVMDILWNMFTHELRSIKGMTQGFLDGIRRKYPLTTLFYCFVLCTLKLPDVYYQLH